MTLQRGDSCRSIVAATPFAPYLSPYTYVNDRPTVLTDPSGQCFFVCAAVGAVAGAVVYGIRVATDENIGFSWKGLGVYTAAGAITGFTGGAASALGLGYLGTATLSGLTSVGTSIATAGVCDAPLPGLADLGVQFFTGGMFSAGGVALERALAGTALTRSLIYQGRHVPSDYLSGTNASVVDIANTGVDVAGDTATSSIGASCK